MGPVGKAFCASMPPLPYLLVLAPTVNTIVAVRNLQIMPVVQRNLQIMLVVRRYIARKMIFNNAPLTCKNVYWRKMMCSISCEALWHFYL